MNLRKHGFKTPCKFNLYRYIAAQRASAGPGMVMPPNLQQEQLGLGGGGGGGRGSANGGGYAADPLGHNASFADFAPPSRMMDLAGSKVSRSGSEKEL
jgi:hypothetical protein